MSKDFIIDDLTLAEVMEILLNQTYRIYNVNGDTKYAFARVPNISLCYAQGKALIEKFNL